MTNEAAKSVLLAAERNRREMDRLSGMTFEEIRAEQIATLRSMIDFNDLSDPLAIPPLLSAEVITIEEATEWLSRIMFQNTQPPPKRRRWWQSREL